MNDSASIGRRQPEKVFAHETASGRYQVEVHAGGTTFFADEPVALGGLGSGPTPYDLLSAALAACTSMTVRLYAVRKGWALAHVFVRVGHSRGSLAAPDRFDRELILEGDLSEDQRAKLLEIANRCPVHATLTRGAEVYTVLGAQSDEEDVQSRHGLHMQHMVESCGESLLMTL